MYGLNMLEFLDSGFDQNVIFQKISFKRTWSKKVWDFGEYFLWWENWHFPT